MSERVCPHGIDLTKACYCKECDDADGTTEAVAGMGRIKFTGTVSESKSCNPLARAEAAGTSPGDSAATTESGRRGHLYLINGSPRSKIAAALAEYREFARSHPDDPLAACLLDTARQIHLALHERRSIERGLTA